MDSEVLRAPGTFIAIVLELALVLAVIAVFRLEEESGIVRLLPLLLAGFVVHAALPRRLRLGFFVLLTGVVIFWLFGAAGMWLVGIGAALIGICHLPLRYGYRVLLLVLASGALALMQVGVFTTAWSAQIVPIIGAVFMFRLILYMYEVRHERTGVTLWQRLAYFFMLPNLLFPLYPVIDYKTFLRAYYDEPALVIYQKGITWMFRGVTHLLLYRIAYMVLPEAEQLGGLAGVASTMILTYALYLRVSGIFHLIVGMLGLFGFNLPETHHHYFLSSGFLDFWRRINIYWKNFMMKVFYYPLYLRLQPIGREKALALGGFLVLIISWVLHSYQWFWLRGTFPMTTVDAIFWLFFAVAVAASSVVEYRKDARVTSRKPVHSLSASLTLSFRVVAFFVFMCGLWTLWSGESVDAFMHLIGQARSAGVTDYLLLLAILTGVGLVGGLFHYARGMRPRRPPETFSPFSVRAGAMAVTLIVLVLLTQPAVHEWAGSRPAALLAAMQDPGLNKTDAEQQERGYYEGVLAPASFTSQVWRQEMQRPRDWKSTIGSGAVAMRPDLLEYELVPSIDIEWKQASFQTNALGFRDREYAPEKPDETVRIALLGASIVLGAGVEQDSLFESLVESALNRHAEATASPTRYEILNLAVGGYSVLQNLVVVKEKLRHLQPDAVLMAIHSTEDRRLIANLIRCVNEDKSLYFARVDSVVMASGAASDMSIAEFYERFIPVSDELVAWGVQEIAREIASMGIQPVAVYIPRVEEAAGVEVEKARHIMEIATTAGFLVTSVENAFSGYTVEDLRLAPWDLHPNATAHRLIARDLLPALYREPVRQALKIEEDIVHALAGAGPSP